MNSNKKTARSEENKAIIRRLTEAENERNPALLDGLVAPHLVDTLWQVRGLESAELTCAQSRKGFPGLQTKLRNSFDPVTAFGSED